MSRAAPWLVSAPDPMTTSPARTWSWIEPDVPMRITVVMPTWASSLTTMLMDGAPIPLVAHTTGAPPGSVATNESRPRLRASAVPSARCVRAISSERPGSPLSRAIVVPSGRSPRPNPMWYLRSSPVMATESDSRRGALLRAAPALRERTGTNSVFAHAAIGDAPLMRTPSPGERTLAADERTDPTRRLPGARRHAAPGGDQVHQLRGDLLRPPQRLRRVLRHRLRAGRRGAGGHRQHLHDRGHGGAGHPGAVRVGGRSTATASRCAATSSTWSPTPTTCRPT